MITLPQDEIQDPLPFLLPPDPDKQEVAFPSFKVTQPIGDFYVATLSYTKLIKISRFDVRRIVRVERELESYLGIQRPIDQKRLADLAKYVNFKDASFPGAVILAVESDYAAFDNETHTLTIRNWRIGDDAPSRNISDIARVIDGQHRIAGLEYFEGDHFDIPVTIFIGADLADQAYIFSTVNLEQTKVTKSLSYDLFALARSRSPQKTCHNIAVALDADAASPFYRKIKRLGLARGNSAIETFTQSTFVEMLMRLISRDPKVDRDTLLRGKRLLPLGRSDTGDLIFRNLFIYEKDIRIAENVNNYFAAVRDRWPIAWMSPAEGNVLGRTNGFRALIRYLATAYKVAGGWDSVVASEAFSAVLRRFDVDDDFFSIERFPPGSSGESRLLQYFQTGEYEPL